MVSAIGGIVTLILGSALVIVAARVRGAMEHDGTLRAVARLPQGAAQEAS
jgi:hypothetical protein